MFAEFGIQTIMDGFELFSENLSHGTHVCRNYHSGCKGNDDAIDR